jgi:hypothetical protein
MVERNKKVTPAMANIGSTEQPIRVPQKALEPLTPEGREWWGMVAEGSVILEPEVLDRLLKATDVKKD